MTETEHTPWTEARARLESYAEFLQDRRYESPYNGRERLRIADLRAALERIKALEGALNMIRERAARSKGDVTDTAAIHSIAFVTLRDLAALAPVTPTEPAAPFVAAQTGERFSYDPATNEYAAAPTLPDDVGEVLVEAHEAARAWAERTLVGGAGSNNTVQWAYAQGLLSQASRRPSEEVVARAISGALGGFPDAPPTDFTLNAARAVLALPAYRITVKQAVERLREDRGLRWYEDAGMLDAENPPT